ncbi:branched chain amino acid aminotransferase, partial [Rhizobium ruizarguesonis]
PGSVVSVDGDSTLFALCLFEAPMGGHGGTSLTVSPYRRPSPETAMTEAKTGSLYPNIGRMFAPIHRLDVDRCRAIEFCDA